jgi:hypothetical protein
MILLGACINSMVEEYAVSQQRQTNLLIPQMLFIFSETTTPGIFRNQYLPVLVTWVSDSTHTGIIVITHAPMDS